MSDDNYNWREINYDDEEKSSISKEKFETDRKYVEANLWDKLEQVGRKISFSKDIIALYKYFNSGKISWHRKVIVLGALVYFVFPIDAIPDLTPLFGYMDDLGVIAALLKYLGSELRAFY